MITCIFAGYYGFSQKCEFKKNLKLTLLSGPMISLIREVNLLGHPQISYLSDLFLNKQERINYKSKLVRGGLFLSRKSIKKMKETLVFYDQSQELKKQLNSIGLSDMREIVTRGLDSWEASQHTLKQLKQILSLKTCRNQINELENKWAKQIKIISSMKWDRKKVIFFLGSVKSKKLAQTMMLNDGFVKLLKKYFKIETYPSSLHYSTWSQRILNKFIDEKTLLIGVNSTDKVFSDQHYSNFKGAKKVDLFDFGALIPGASQLSFLESLAKWQKTLKD